MSKLGLARPHTIVALCMAMGSAAFADRAIAVREWRHPAWITPSRPTNVEIALQGRASADAMVLTFALPDGTGDTVPCASRDAMKTDLTCVIPAIKRGFDGTIRFWLEVRSSKEGAETLRSEVREVPISREIEIEVSGQADENLTYPIIGWECEILFKPCCYIPLGTIQAERIPVDPHPNGEGLPDALLSSFYAIQPDDMVKATGGVNIRAYYGTTKGEDLEPETIGAYHWKDKRWQKVIDCVVDSSARIATFPFANGGTFVIAGETKRR